MIVDTSAVMAIVRSEPEAPVMQRVLAGNRGRLAMSTGNWIELAAVLMRYADPASQTLAEQLLENAAIRFVPVSVEQARIARDAYRRYGRGTGHPARLNFGDCFAYALAKERGEALLFKGADFARTDVRPAI